MLILCAALDAVFRMKSPAFRFYVDDFLGGTMHFTDAEVGLYVRLLCLQWSKGCLSDDDTELSSYGKGGTPLARIRAKFVKGSDGMLRNDRMEIERRKQLDYRDKQVENGRMGGRPVKAKPNPSLSSGLSQTKAKKSLPFPSSVSVSVSDSELPLISLETPEAAKPRERNVLFDALCLFENTPVDQVGKAAGRIAVALRDIKTASPGVTPEEIARRGENYKTLFTVTPTANGLASHWGKCHEAAPKRSFNGSVVAPVRLGQNLT